MLSLNGLFVKICFAVLSLFLNDAQADPDAPCYFPSGDLATGYYPCISYNAEISACCKEGWSCYSNGLCVMTDPTESSNSDIPIGTSERSGCTEPNWSSEICGDFCLHTGDFNASLQPCGNSNFCCADDVASGNCSCDTSVGIFSVGQGVFQTAINIFGTYTETPNVVPSTSAGLVHTTTASRTLITTSTTVKTAFSTAVVSSTANSVSSVAPSGTPTSQNGLQNSTTSRKSITDTTRFKVGMGVGMGVGVPVAVAVGWILFKCCWKGREGSKSPPPYKPRVTGIPYVPPTEDPYFDMNSQIPLQTHPGPSRSGTQFVAPSDNPYELNSPSRTTSPVSPSNTPASFQPRVALGRRGRGWADG